MPKQFLAILCSIALFVLALVACEKDTKPGPSSNLNTTPYVLNYPDHFPQPVVPDANPTTEEGVRLGRRLYYDPKMSLNGPMQGSSCSSCHQQTSSFSSHASGTAVMAHVNLGWNSNFLWNGQVEGTLEDIMKFEVEDFFQTDLDVLKEDPTYTRMFKDAFKNGEINYENTEFALSQFFRTLVSYNSRYDSIVFGPGPEAYTPEEKAGYDIFFSEAGDCFHCHTQTMLMDNDFHNIGLDSTFVGESQGRYLITGLDEDMGKFKTPTLRNIQYTAPYMHDGRFATLEEVIDHYNSGVKGSDHVDPIMTKDNKNLRLNLSDEDKEHLIAFLKTLTDYRMITDTSLASPF